MYILCDLDCLWIISYCVFFLCILFVLQLFIIKLSAPPTTRNILLK